MWAWALLPVTLAVFGTIGLWVVFGIAVSNNTVNITEEFPTISKCGANRPQSCWFSQICNICCMLELLIISIRFQQIRDFGYAFRINGWGLVFGFISSIGISIVGNFQSTEYYIIHLVGAVLGFLLGLAYFWTQAFLTRKAQPRDRPHPRQWVWWVRLILCSLCTFLAFCMACLFFIESYHWAAICEWTLVTCFFVLLGFFTFEFSYIDFFKLTVQKEGMKKANEENASDAMPI